jgi:hypothetical protein
MAWVSMSRICSARAFMTKSGTGLPNQRHADSHAVNRPGLNGSFTGHLNHLTCAGGGDGAVIFTLVDKV